MENREKSKIIFNSARHKIQNKKRRSNFMQQNRFFYDYIRSFLMFRVVGFYIFWDGCKRI